MAQTFLIRKAEEKDRNPLKHILREFYGESFKEEQLLARIEEQISSVTDKHALFLAEKNGEPVAVAYVIEDRGSFLVEDLYTHPEYKGQGMASALLNRCEDFARSKGSSYIHLNVATDDPALVAFYEKRGWSRQLFNDAACGIITDIDPSITLVRTYLMVKPMISRTEPA